jgi:hypothetical protein
MANMDKRRSDELREKTEAALRPIRDDATKAAIAQRRAGITAAAKEGNWRKAMAALCEIPAVRGLYDGDARVSEGYTVGKHTQMVLQQFDDQKRFFKLDQIGEKMRTIPGFESFDVNRFMVTMLLLHDIGKSIGQDSSEQHLFTVPIMGTIMGELGFSEKEIKLAQLIVGNDILGEFEKNGNRVLPTSVFRVVSQMRSLAAEAGLVAEEEILSALFFQVAKALYVSDASSYPYTYQNFMTRTPDGRIKFKIKPGEEQGRLDSVEAAVEEPKVSLGEMVNSLLQKKSLAVADLFDMANYRGQYTVFDVARHIEQNWATLRSIPFLGKNEALILEMVECAKEFEELKFTADHAGWVIHGRLSLRGLPVLEKLRGKGPDDLMVKGEGTPLQREYMEVLQKLARQRIGNDKFDVGRFMKDYYYTTSPECQGFKLLAAQARTIPMDERVWIRGVGVAHRELRGIGERCGLTSEQMKRVWACVRASSIEITGAMDFPGKGPDGRFTLLRTEARAVLETYGVQMGADPAENGRKMRHTALDCSTCDCCVVEYGTEITLYRNVPPALIFSTWMIHPCSPQRTVVFDPHGLPVSYVGSVVGDKAEGLTPFYARDTQEGSEAQMLRERFGLIPYRDGSGKKVYQATKS